MKMDISGRMVPAQLSMSVPMACVLILSALRERNFLKSLAYVLVLAKGSAK